MENRNEKIAEERKDGHERMHAAENRENALLLKWLGTGMNEEPVGGIP